MSPAGKAAPVSSLR